MKKTNRYSGKSGIYVSVVPVYGMRRLLDAITPLLPEAVTLDLDEAHCTIIYSRFHQPHSLIAEDFANRGDRQFNANVVELKQWPGHDNAGYLVAALYSDDLQARHRHWLSAGAVHSFDDYLPHVTLATGLDLLDRQTLKTVNKAIHNANLRLVFAGEHIEDIKE